MPGMTDASTIRGVVRTTSGVRIHYRRMGQGPGLVLLHGYPQTGHMWRKVMPALAAHFSVVAPDLRGYGDSDRPTTGYDKRTMAADIVEVIGALALGPVVLVGHDRGARVAHRLALDHPAALTRLGWPVEDSGHFIPEEQPQAVIDAILKFATT